MSWLLILPIVAPFAVAVLTFLVRRSPWLERSVSVAGAALLLGLALALLIQVNGGGMIAATMGAWPAPFGIALVADHFSAIMVVVTGFTGLVVAVYSLGDIDRPRERVGFHSLFHILLGGVCGGFLTGDIFNLYVWFEVMLITSFALLILGGEKIQLDGAVKYVALNLFATALFLVTVGLLYGLTGTLNMAELHLRLEDSGNGGLVSAIAVLFLVAFGIKAAIFPLFFWLPASYHTPSVAVTAIFSALLTKVGVYAMIRLFTLVFPPEVASLETLIFVLAALTMVTGVLGAAAQNEFRKILSFHIVSQIGYIVLGLALATTLGLMGAVFYLVHNIIAKTNLFLVSGVARRLTGTFELGGLGGLYRTAPFLSTLFLITALSLAGVPPLSGFWAKLLVVQASLEVEAYTAVAVALGVGLLTLYSMTKIWNQAFWKPQPLAERRAAAGLTRLDRTVLLGPIVAMTAVTILMGVWAEPFLALAGRAADELSNPRLYVEAVLGVRP